MCVRLHVNPLREEREEGKSRAEKATGTPRPARMGDDGIVGTPWVRAHAFSPRHRRRCRCQRVLAQPNYARCHARIT